MWFTVTDFASLGTQIRLEVKVPLKCPEVYGEDTNKQINSYQVIIL